MEARAPAIALAQRGAQREDASHRWRIRWAVANRGEAPLELFSARLPHGQFKGDGNELVPALTLAGGAAAEFETFVRCEEPPGPVTDNAFVIFEAVWLGAPWRIFVRLRVEINGAGEPGTSVQSITTQQAGFSRHLQTN